MEISSIIFTVIVYISPVHPLDAPPAATKYAKHEQLYSPNNLNHTKNCQSPQLFPGELELPAYSSIRSLELFTNSHSNALKETSTMASTRSTECGSLVTRQPPNVVFVRSTCTRKHSPTNTSNTTLPKPKVKRQKLEIVRSSDLFGCTVPIAMTWWMDVMRHM